MPKSGTVLAFDFGEKRIGVAMAELSVGIAHPLKTIHAEDNLTRFQQIAALIQEWRPVSLVVGEPHHANGSPHATGRLARRFAQRLTGRFDLPVHLTDETLSSHEAQILLQERGLHAEKIKAVIDSVAAAAILTTWLSQQHTP